MSRMLAKSTVFVLAAQLCIAMGFVGIGFAQTPIVASQTARIQVQIDWHAEPFYAGIYVAKAKGWFSEAGFDVEILQGNGAANAAQLIGTSSGPIIGTSSASETVLARAKGIPIRSLAVLMPNTPYVLVSLPRAPIAKPSDLIGRKIGVIPGTLTPDEFHALISANGIKRDQVQEIAVDFTATALLSGQVDALIFSEDNVPLQLKLQGYNPTILRFRDFGVDVYSLNLIANDQAVERRPDVLAKLVAVISRGYEFVRSDPAESAQIFSKIFPERDQLYVRESTKVVGSLVGAGKVGEQTTQGWSHTISTLVQLGILKVDIDPGQVFVNLR